MKPNQPVPPASALLLLALLVACGPDERAEPEASGPREIPPESQINVLEPDDLAGLEEENVVFNLHWVGGPVNRNPAPDAETTTVEAVSTLAATGFDRAVFRFAEGSFPGYAVEWTEEPPVDCATGQPAEVPGERHLRVVLRPATVGGDAARPQLPAHPNLQALASTCSREGEAEWHLGVQGTAQVRVVEMREPQRLVVDVQHAEGRGY